MTKNFKRLLALFMTVMLIFGVVPTTVYAAEAPSEPEGAVSSEPSSEATPEPSLEPESSEAPSEAAPSPEPEGSELTSGTELPVTQIWPAPRRKAARPRSAPTALSTWVTSAAPAAWVLPLLWGNTSVPCPS